MLKETFIAVISAVISGIVLTFAGYLFIIKENQVILQSLKGEVADIKKDALRAFEIEIDNFKEIKIKIEKSDTSLNAIKLFIASAHPDKNISMLSSLEKLNDLSIPELEQLAAGMKHKEVLKEASSWYVPPSDEARMNSYLVNHAEYLARKELLQPIELVGRLSLSGEDIDSYASIIDQ